MSGRNSATCSFILRQSALPSSKTQSVCHFWSYRYFPVPEQRSVHTFSQLRCFFIRSEPDWNCHDLPSDAVQAERNRLRRYCWGDAQAQDGDVPKCEEFSRSSLPQPKLLLNPDISLQPWVKNDFPFADLLACLYIFSRPCRIGTGLAELQTGTRFLIQRCKGRGTSGSKTV